MVRDSSARKKRGEADSFFFSLALLYGTEKERGYDSRNRTERGGLPWLYRREEGSVDHRARRPALIVRVPLQAGPLTGDAGVGVGGVAGEDVSEPLVWF